MTIIQRYQYHHVPLSRARMIGRPNRVMTENLLYFITLCLMRRAANSTERGKNARALSGSNPGDLFHV